MAKASDMYSVNGCIYNEIANIIAKNTLNKVDSCLIICADDEVFEQAMQTVVNKHPNAYADKGAIQAADAGMKRQVYETDIWIEHAGTPNHYRNRFYVVTDSIYQSNSAAINALNLGVKHFIASTGGAI